VSLAALGVTTLQLHEPDERMGVSALRGQWFDAAAVHPDAPHHFDPSRPEYREECAACLANARPGAQRVGVPPALVAPRAVSDPPTGPVVLLAMRSVSAPSGRAPPGLPPSA
jgi:hypothetical protein